MVRWGCLRGRFRARAEEFSAAVAQVLGRFGQSSNSHRKEGLCDLPNSPVTFLRSGELTEIIHDGINKRKALDEATTTFIRGTNSGTSHSERFIY